MNRTLAWALALLACLVPVPGLAREGRVTMVCHADAQRGAEPMIVVPAGEFLMGSDAAERRRAKALSSPAVRDAGWIDEELPRHTQRLAAFCIDRHLVTQAEYARFVGATEYPPPGISKAAYQRQGFLVHDYDREVTLYLWRSGTPPQRLLDHPVVLVSADDAAAYCRWRDPELRLPTESEWEHAARDDRASMFPWGDTWDPLRLNSEAGGVGGTTPVTRYPTGASPYGVLDSVGNVFQWTSSTLADGRRVLKGCSWDDEPGLCRPAFRHGRPAGSRHILIGFRCAGPTATERRTR